MGTSTGDTAVHLRPVCGHSGRQVDNEPFFGKVLEYVARLGSAPHVVGADINDTWTPLAAWRILEA